jgi:hypothetical protein
MPKAISQDRLNNVPAGLDAGHCYAKIQRDAHVSHGTVFNIRSQHWPDLKMSTGGCPHKLFATAVRYAVCLITNHNCVSAIQVTQTRSGLTGESISAETVQRH